MQGIKKNKYDKRRSIDRLFVVDLNNAECAEHGRSKNGKDANGRDVTNNNADQALALERAAARDGADIEAIKARMAVQRSADELRKMADYTIYNIDLNELPNQVAEVDHSLREL